MGNKLVPLNVDVGQMLQEARVRGGVTQAQMCEITGLSKNHISAVERGVSKASVKMLMGYCSKLELTPNDILGYRRCHNLIPELESLLSRIDEENQKRLIEIIKNSRLLDEK